MPQKVHFVSFGTHFSSCLFSLSFKIFAFILHPSQQYFFLFCGTSFPHITHFALLSILDLLIVPTHTGHILFRYAIFLRPLAPAGWAPIVVRRLAAAVAWAFVTDGLPFFSCRFAVLFPLVVFLALPLENDFVTFFRAIFLLLMRRREIYAAHWAYLSTFPALRYSFLLRRTILFIVTSLRAFW